MTDLGTLGGRESYAYDINAAGQVVGWSNTAAGDRHAFITGPDGAGMTDLEVPGETQSFAIAINDAGQVVGNSFTSTGGGHAFITGLNGAGMTDLNSLVDLPAGIVLDAIDINNKGQVLVISQVPEPETYALMLTGLGLIGFMAWRKKSGSRV